jgi:hypothetical protein
MTGRTLTGKEIEQWLLNVADQEAIASDQVYSFRNLCNLLNSELPRRLENSRLHLFKDFPEGNEWIDDVLIWDKEPKISPLTKQEFCLYLLDRVAAIDAVVELNNSEGETVRLAIDVTSKEYEEQSKVHKIIGKPDPNDWHGRLFNFKIIFPILLENS